MRVLAGIDKNIVILIINGLNQELFDKNAGCEVVIS